MSRTRPPLLPLHAIPPGEMADCFALLTERTKSQTREGKPFYTCRFRDNQRVATCMVWGDGTWFNACDRDWQESQCYKLRVVYGEHEKYGGQIELHNIRLVNETDQKEGFDLSKLVPSSRFQPSAMLQELLTLARGEIHDEPLRRLVVTLLERHGAKLQVLPASDKFFPFCGGWLEHVHSVARNCLHLTDHYLAHYPDAAGQLNRDLVIAGALLHDIGRVVEYGEEPVAPQPTVPGKLFGHLILGRDLVHAAAQELGDVNPQTLQLLEHLVLTHLALPEWGSPRLPLIPEALILHHADDLDAKLEMYLRCLTRDQGPGPFTARDPVLGKGLLKRTRG
jgi:3'-5' exoribonuclease